MKTPRLIAIDMDGTLLGSDGRVSERNLRSLERARAAGIEIVIATGRRHSYAMRVLRELDFHPENVLVSSNGTVIRTIGSELMHRHHMSPETARWLCSHAAEFRNAMVITFDNVGADGDDSQGALVVEELEHLHSSIGRWMEVNAPYIAQMNPIESALEDGAPIQMMVCGTIARMREAEALLMQHPAVHNAEGSLSHEGAEVTLHRTEYPERDLCIVDILPAGVSKASALKHLAELRGFEMEDTLAIGDNWNDLPMLQAAGSAVVMNNAPADLKAMAEERGWAITLSNDEDGVAEALEAVLRLAEAEPVPV